MKILIVEDEKIAVERLQAVLKKTAVTITSISVSTSIADTINWFSSNEQPDIIFLDIQLSDGVSFEIFNHIKITCPIIFVTAFNQYAVDAFKVNSIDYILKPYTIKDIKKALKKYQNLNQKSQLDEAAILKLKSVFNPKYKSRFFARINNAIYSFAINEILYFKVEDHVTLLTTAKHNRSYIINYSLDALDKFLDPSLFFRINRHLIIKIDSIKKMHILSASRIEIIFNNDTKDVVSRSKTKSFKSWLDI